jgi:hypothetical protein
VDPITLLHNPLAQVWAAVAVLAAAVHALPEPTTASGLFYRWLYGFAHALPANWAEVLKAISPQAVAPADPPAK